MAFPAESNLTRADSSSAGTYALTTTTCSSFAEALKTPLPLSRQTNGSGENRGGLSPLSDEMLPWGLEAEDINPGHFWWKRLRNFGTRGSEAQMMAVVISAILAEDFR